MLLSDLDGFLTGILCSPDLIMPSEWLPIVWGDKKPSQGDMDAHIWATQAILERYNQIAQALNSEPPFVEPIFLQAPEGHVIAMDWCEGFMQAVHLHKDRWEELLKSKRRRDWLFPIMAHLLDENGNSLVGAHQEELDGLMDTSAKRIPEVVTNIFAYWRSKRTPKG